MRYFFLFQGEKKKIRERADQSGRSCRFVNESESATYRDSGGESAGAGLEGVDQTKHGVWRMGDGVGVGGKEEV